VNTKFYKAAGITIELRSDFPITENTFYFNINKFEVDGPGDDNIRICHHFHPPPLTEETIRSSKEIYNKAQWKILKAQDSWIYSFKSLTTEDPGHSAIGIFSEDFTSLSVYTEDFNRKSYQNARLDSLTLFNSDQTLFSRLLQKRNGFILHSNGFDINGSGILIAGRSGAGKSTLSGMLKRDGHRILCDDKMFITSKGDEFLIHGNWCHGTVPDASTGSAPLKAVFFLEQSTDNEIKTIDDKRAATHYLLQALVQPVLPPEGWTKTIDLIHLMAKQVQCYRVKFDLSGNICNIIRALLK
jgi:hypothetical protein